VWDITSGGTEVAAVEIGEGPLLLLADHLPAPSCELVYEVKDLRAASEALRSRGWKPEGRSFEIPNGPCYVFKDPSGNRLVIFQDRRPGVLSGDD